MWLARIFSSLWLLGANAGKPRNERRGRGKNTGISKSRGRGCCLGKLFPDYIKIMPGYPGAFTLKKSGSEISTPDFLSSLSSFNLRHKHIYSFKQNLFTFQESDIRRPAHSAVPQRSRRKAAVWHRTRTPLKPTFSPEENRGLSKPTNQLPSFWGYLIVDQLINGNDCNQTLNVSCPTLPQQCQLAEHCCSGRTGEQSEQVSRGLPQAGHRTQESMQHVYTDSAFFPPPLPNSTHTKPLHQGEYCCDEALER